MENSLASAASVSRGENKASVFIL